MSVIFNGEEVIPDDCQVFHDGHEVAYIIFNGGVAYEAPPDAPAEILPTSVSIDYSGSTTIRRGQSVTVTAVVLPENTTDKSVTWEYGSRVTVEPGSGNTATVTGVSSGSSAVQVRTSNGLTDVIIFIVR